jgi:HK97 family phage prohead protease
VPDLEMRTVTAQFEMRDDSTTGAPILQGYAATFNQEYDLGPFRERIAPTAFQRSLSSGADVRLLVDHQGQPLARTKSGTLKLSSDGVGMRAEATLDPSDPDVQRLLPKMRRGDLDQMSFAFRVPKGGDSWSEDNTLRTLNEVNLAGGDVSVVTYPANPATSVSVRAEDLREARCVFVERMVAEMRSGNPLSPSNMAKLARVLPEMGQVPPEFAGIRSLDGTYNDTREALDAAVTEAHGGAKDVWTYVLDFDDETVWYSVCSGMGETSDTYQQGYTIADGTATLTGSPIPVRRRTEYIPIDAAQQNSASIEFSRRMALAIEFSAA